MKHSRLLKPIKLLLNLNFKFRLFFLETCKKEKKMSFDATCTCPNCGEFWYECANYDETFTCPKCGHQNIEPEEIDLIS